MATKPSRYEVALLLTEFSSVASASIVTLPPEDTTWLPTSNRIVDFEITSVDPYAKLTDFGLVWVIPRFSIVATSSSATLSTLVLISMSPSAEIVASEETSMVAFAIFTNSPKANPNGDLPVFSVRVFQTAFPKAFAVAVALRDTSEELWIEVFSPMVISETGSQTCAVIGRARRSGLGFSNASRKTFDAKWTWLAMKSPTNSFPLSVLIVIAPPSMTVDVPTVIVDFWPWNARTISSICMTALLLYPLRTFSDRSLIAPSCSTPVAVFKGPLAVIWTLFPIDISSPCIVMLPASPTTVLVSITIPSAIVTLEVLSSPMEYELVPAV